MTSQVYAERACPVHMATSPVTLDIASDVTRVATEKEETHRQRTVRRKSALEGIPHLPIRGIGMRWRRERILKLNRCIAKREVELYR